MTTSKVITMFRKPQVLGGLVLVGALYAFAASARPVPPANGLLIYTYYQNGVAVGGEVIANCPPDSPVPMPWGIQTREFSWSYAPCF